MKPRTTSSDKTRRLIAKWLGKVMGSFRVSILSVSCPAMPTSYTPVLSDFACFGSFILSVSRSLIPWVSYSLVVSNHQATVHPRHRRRSAAYPAYRFPSQPKAIQSSYGAVRLASCRRPSRSTQSTQSTDRRLNADSFLPRFLPG